MNISEYHEKHNGKLAYLVDSELDKSEWFTFNETRRHGFDGGFLKVHGGNLPLSNFGMHIVDGQEVELVTPDEPKAELQRQDTEACKQFVTLLDQADGDDDYVDYWDEARKQYKENNFGNRSRLTPDDLEKFMEDDTMTEFAKFLVDNSHRGLSNEQLWIEFHDRKRWQRSGDEFEREMLRSLDEEGDILAGDNFDSENVERDAVEMALKFAGDIDPDDPENHLSVEEVHQLIDVWPRHGMTQTDLDFLTFTLKRAEERESSTMNIIKEDTWAMEDRFNESCGDDDHDYDRDEY